MPVIITPAPDPATTRPAQDPQWVVRPRSHLTSHPGDDQHAAVCHWQSLIERGLLGCTSPPTPPPDVVARRDANDALFRERARAHARAGLCPLR